MNKKHVILFIPIDFENEIRLNAMHDSVSYDFSMTLSRNTGYLWVPGGEKRK